MELRSIRIFLTGFMGSGKSTLGPPLAAALQLRFADLDDLVALRAGQSIAAIFAQGGEAQFRALESAELRETRAGFVYAVGGGALVQEENLAWARAHGIVVYLEVPVHELQRRLSADRTTRPLLQGPQGQALASAALSKRIALLLASRMPYYRRAHITVQAAARNPDLVCSAVQAIKDYRAQSLNDLR